MRALLRKLALTGPHWRPYGPHWRLYMIYMVYDGGIKKKNEVFKYR
jgi:hypothetical protein